MCSSDLDITIERPLKISLYDKKDRLVREVSAGTATALVHCPETVPAQPPTGPAPRVLLGSTCTRGVDCPPLNHSMALGGTSQGTTSSSQQRICTQTPRTASASSAAQPANATDPVPLTWAKPRIVNREPLIGERTVSSARVQKLPPQRVKAVTPRMQAPGKRRTVARTTRETGPKGIIVGTARGAGTRGIIVGTCRNLQKRPIRDPSVGTDGTGRLLFPLSDGRTMVLPDGIYKDKSGIRIHMFGGRIVMVDGILPR